MRKFSILLGNDLKKNVLTYRMLMILCAIVVLGVVMVAVPFSLKITEGYVPSTDEDIIKEYRQQIYELEHSGGDNKKEEKLEFLNSLLENKVTDIELNSRRVNFTEMSKWYLMGLTVLAALFAVPMWNRESKSGNILTLVTAPVSRGGIIASKLITSAVATFIMTAIWMIFYSSAMMAIPDKGNFIMCLMSGSGWGYEVWSAGKFLAVSGVYLWLELFSVTCAVTLVYCIIDNAYIYAIAPIVFFALSDFMASMAAYEFFCSISGAMSLAPHLYKGASYDLNYWYFSNFWQAGVCMIALCVGCIALSVALLHFRQYKKAGSSR